MVAEALGPIGDSVGHFSVGQLGVWDFGLLGGQARDVQEEKQSVQTS